MTRQQNNRKNDIQTLILYVSGFLDLFGVSMIIPLIKVHSRELGASPTVSGILGSVYGAIQLFSSPVIGSWSDIKGRHFTLMVCLFMAGFGYSIFSVAKTITLMFVARIPLGIFKHSQSISKAYLAEMTTKAEQPKVLGNFNAVSSLGFILGPLVGGNIAEHPQGFYLVSLLTASIFILNGCIIWLFGIETKHKDIPESSEETSDTDEINFSLTKFLDNMKEMDWKDLWDLYLIKMILAISVILFWSSFSLILLQKFDSPPSTIGYVISFKSTISAFFGFFTGRISNFYTSNAKLLLHLSIIQGITLIILGIAPTLWVFVLSLIPLAMTTTVARVTSTSLSMERSSKEDIGLLLGFQQSCTSVARMLAPIVSGVALEISSSAPGIVGGVLSLIVVCIMLIRPQDPRDRARISAKKHQ